MVGLLRKHLKLIEVLIIPIIVGLTVGLIIVLFERYQEVNQPTPRQYTVSTYHRITNITPASVIHGDNKYVYFFEARIKNSGPNDFPDSVPMSIEYTGHKNVKMIGKAICSVFDAESKKKSMELYQSNNHSIIEINNLLLASSEYITLEFFICCDSELYPDNFRINTDLPDKIDRKLIRYYTEVDRSKIKKELEKLQTMPKGSVQVFPDENI